jgi:hypothetical protein
MIETVFILLAACLAIFAIGKARFSFFLIAVLLLILPISGALTYALEGKSSFDTFFGLTYSVIALILGYWFVSSLIERGNNSIDRRAKLVNPKSPREASFAEPELWVVSVFVALGTVWHFAVGGIPLFSSEVELLRFDFTSSGLFGIPGRLYLFGTKISWILTSAFLSTKGVSWASSSVWRFSTATLVISTLLSGFKGGIVVTGLMMACTYFLFTNNSKSLFSIARRFWWVFLLGMANFLLVGTTYASYQLKDRSLLSQLIDRINIGSAEAAVIALQGNFQQVSGNWLVLDWTYFISKYSGNATTGLFTLEQAVSATANGLPLDSGFFISPVTIGAYPYLAVTFNMWVALLCIFGIGGLISYLQRISPVSVFSKSLVAIALVVCTEMLTKGVFVYALLNFGALTVLIFTLVVLARVFRVKSEKKFSQKSESRIDVMSQDETLTSLPTTLAK